MNISLKRIIFGFAMALVLFAVVFSVPGAMAVNAETANIKEDIVIITANEEGEETEEAASEKDNTIQGKAIAAGIAIGLAAAAGAIGMGIAIAKSSEGIARQPEAEGKIRSNLMIGLVFIETAIIYSLIVAILIIFVL